MAPVREQSGRRPRSHLDGQLVYTGGQRLYQIHNFSQKFLVLAEKHALHVDAMLGAASIHWVHLWPERAIT